MPVARFQMPDGRIARFEVPEGTTPEQANAQIQQMVASGPMGQQAQAQQQASDVPPATGQAPVSPAAMQAREQAEPSFVDRLNQEILNAPGGTALAEFGAAINRGAVNLADFFTTKPVRAVQQLAGVPEEERLTTLAETDLGQSATVGDYMEPGLARDIVQTSGELVAPGAFGGQMFRTAAKTAEPLLRAQGATTEAGIKAAQLARPEATTRLGRFGQSLERTVPQLGGSTARQDIVGATASGAGAEFGEEYGGQLGAIAGAIAAPMAAFGTPNMIKNTFKAGKNAVNRLVESLKGMSDDGAATLLADQMVREGLSPDDVARRLQELGPEGVTADVATGFRRLLKLAGQKVPRIQGATADVMKARQSGQGDRILNAFDDATGTASLNVDDEIVRLNQAYGPKIDELYAATRARGIDMAPSKWSLGNALSPETYGGTAKRQTMSTRLSRLLSEEKNSLAKARRKANQRLLDKRAAGDRITGFDVIDATKQEMDDQIGRFIRQGENNKVRDLIRLKNIMIDEADKAIPEYKQARDMFAGKASLENAADSGQLFLKLKPRDLDELTKTYGQSEKHMFKLGAKQAILDKIDDLQTNADAIKRLFGKNGDVKKLRSLFDSEDDYTRFADTLKRESDFIMTRNSMGGSDTAANVSDAGMGFEVLRDMAEASASPSGAARIIQRISDGLRREKSSAEYVKSLEDAGDILLIKGIEPERIIKLLNQGTAKGIKSRVEKALKKPTIKAYKPSAAIGSSIETAEAVEQE